MASFTSKSKPFVLPFATLSIALLFLVTNYAFFTINYTRQQQDEFQNMTTYLAKLRNPEWYEVISRETTKDETVKVGLLSMDLLRDGFGRTKATQNANPYLKPAPKWFEVIAQEYLGGKAMIKIGLVNMDDDDDDTMDEVPSIANTKAVKVHFDRVSEDIRWPDLAPERINQSSKCPDIPMPRFEDYKELDMVVARVRCDNSVRRDVSRLQVNMVVANLLIKSGRKGSNRSPLFAVFVGSCEPMWEMFRCEDLLWNEGNTWVYKPEISRLKQRMIMPVGACQFVPPFSQHGDNEAWEKETIAITQTNREAREAYVTVLHTSEDYVCGAIVLAQSIIQSNSTKDLILLADDHISPESISGLRLAGWKVRRIRRIRSPYSKANTYNEWNYSKLRIWQLKDYDKLMFIDADLVVHRNMDKFFAYPQLTAAGNYQKHLFNSGLMLVEPSDCAFKTLVKKMMVVESYNGGDQGFLNEMFAWWHRLPAEANYLKVFVDVDDHEHWVSGTVNYAVHYTGLKPWKCDKEETDCNWDLPEFHRYASNSAYGMWRKVYKNMPENLRPYCERISYGEDGDEEGETPIGN